jgi:integrase
MEAPTSDETVNSLLDIYLRHKKKQMKERGQPEEDYKKLESILQPVRAAWGLLRYPQITRQKSRDYADKRRKDGLLRKSKKPLSNATIRKELAMANAAFQHCRKENIIPVAPALAYPPKPAARERYLTREEIKALLNGCAQPHIRLFCLLAIHTASRRGAILELKWEQVDMEQRRIHFNPEGRVQTSKRRVAAPINKTLYAALENARLLAQTDYVIEYEGHAPIKNPRRAFKTAAKRAGLKGVSPHTIRHTGATLLAQAGVDMYTIAGLLGDRVTTVEKNYLKWSPDHLTGATKALEGIA